MFKIPYWNSVKAPDKSGAQDLVVEILVEQTCPGLGPDISDFAYWSPVEGAGLVRCMREFWGTGHVRSGGRTYPILLTGVRSNRSYMFGLFWEVSLEIGV
jgi:hypothetical protein